MAILYGVWQGLAFSRFEEIFHCLEKTRNFGLKPFSLEIKTSGDMYLDVVYHQRLLKPLLAG